MPKLKSGGLTHIMQASGNSAIIYCALLKLVPNQVEMAIKSAMKGNVPDLSEEPTLKALAEISVRLAKNLDAAEVAVRGEVF